MNKKDSGSIEKNLVPEKLKIALWILDSHFTNPSLESILNFTKAKSLVEAEKKLSGKIKQNKFEKIYYDIELPLINVLKGMEKKGILLDLNYLKKLSVQYHKKLKKLEKEIWNLAGQNFNINSPQQLGVILFEKLKLSPKGLRKTGKGVRSTRFSELIKLSDQHPIINLTISYRELAKLVSTYIDVFPKLVKKDGRLHTKFNQTGTATGRLSSQKPNLQNIPTRTDFGRAVRRAFVVPGKTSLVSFDYSQIELRVAASLSGDKKLKQAFLEEKDIHSATASQIFKVQLEEVTPEMRRRAKILNFGILYGMGINAFRQEAEVTREEAENFFQDYFITFKDLTEYLEKVKDNAKKNGYVQTLFGRRRYLPEINSIIPSIRAEAERMAINHPIQGTASDIVKIAMINIYKIINKEYKNKVFLILQVHDELLFEMEDNIIKEVVLILKGQMINAANLSVPLIVNVSKGKNLNDLKKIN